jgi:hypothetical protein
MPKRKLQNEDGAPSIYTFRLVNGESFDVQGVKVLVEQLVYKSIEYTNKKLLEGPPAPQIEEGAEVSGEVREKGKIGRRRYSREEKKLMIGIYDKYPIKEAAMEVLPLKRLALCVQNKLLKHLQFCQLRSSTSWKASRASRRA